MRTTRPTRVHRALMSLSVVAAASHGAALAEPACAPAWDTRYGAFDHSGFIGAMTSEMSKAGPLLYFYANSFGMEYDTDDPSVDPLTQRSGVFSWDGERFAFVAPFSLPSWHGVRPSMTRFDDGDGDAFFIAGDFQNTTSPGTQIRSIVRVRNGAISDLESGLKTISVLPFPPAPPAPGDPESENDPTREFVQVRPGKAHAIAVFDDGDGPALYVGGEFNHAGDTPIRHIARWTNTGWSPVGSAEALDKPVLGLTVFDDGDGPALYAVGEFTQIEGVGAAPGVARWTGSAWEPVGSNLVVASWANRIRSLCVHDAGDGPALFASGTIAYTDGMGQTVHASVARLVGDAWESLPVTDPDSLPAPSHGADILLSHDDALIAIGGWAVRWRDGRWEPIGQGVTSGGVVAAHSVETSTGPELFLSGEFIINGGEKHSLARLRDDRLEPMLGGLDFTVRAVRTLDLGEGPAVYLGGGFSNALDWNNGRAIVRVGETGFLAIGDDDSPVRNVYAIEAFDAGDGPELVVGGLPGSSGAQAHLARHRNGAWEALDVNGEVYSLRAHNGLLYAAGLFSQVDGLNHRHLAWWDGAQWSGPTPAPSHAVYATEFFDDGGGEALYAGGVFTQIPGVADATRIAKWDGAAWEALGAGLSGIVRTMLSADIGDGPSLYVGGDFLASGSQQLRRVARWDGAQWHPMGAGLHGAVRSLFLFDDDTGEALYAVGDFTPGPGAFARRIAKWNGAAWVAPSWAANGFDKSALSVAAISNGATRSLFVGGAFRNVDGAPSLHIARLSFCLSEDCPGDANGDGVVDFDDLATVLGNYGMSGDGLEGDLNGDGAVDFDDLSIVLGAFGQSC